MVGRRGGKRKKWAGRRGWENGRNRQNKKISKGVKKEENCYTAPSFGKAKK